MKNWLWWRFWAEISGIVLCIAILATMRYYSQLEEPERWGFKIFTYLTLLFVILPIALVVGGALLVSVVLKPRGGGQKRPMNPEDFP